MCADRLFPHWYFLRLSLSINGKVSGRSSTSIFAHSSHRNRGNPPTYYGWFTRPNLLMVWSMGSRNPPLSRYVMLLCQILGVIGRLGRSLRTLYLNLVGGGRVSRPHYRELCHSYYILGSSAMAPSSGFGLVHGRQRVILRRVEKCVLLVRSALLFPSRPIIYLLSLTLDV